MWYILILFGLLYTCKARQSNLYVSHNSYIDATQSAYRIRKRNIRIWIKIQKYIKDKIITREKNLKRSHKKDMKRLKTINIAVCLLLLLIFKALVNRNVLRPDLKDCKVVTELRYCGSLFRAWGALKQKAASPCFVLAKVAASRPASERLRVGSYQWSRSEMYLVLAR